MKIVILDAYSANPGDIDWLPIDALGEVIRYDRTPQEQVVERCADAECVLTNKVVLSAEVLRQLPSLRYVGVLATGYNVVDCETARQLGIIVTNIPAYSTMSVAQMVFAHLLNVTHHVAGHSACVAEGAWQQSIDFCFWNEPLIELDHKVMGLVGLGNTGLATARIALAFGMQVMAFTSKSQEQLKDLGLQGIDGQYIRKADSLEQLFAESDVVSLHCPLSPQTHHLVNAERLSLMKPSAVLINTGRGPLVDEQALADALNTGLLQAACVDVLEQEPPRNGSPLIGARNCQITPHVAWATQAARQRLWQIAVDNVRAYQNGQPVNVVNR